MHRLLSRFGLPLLAKELIEQAARKRTYVLRVVYAVLLFGVTFLAFYGTLAVLIRRGSATALMGQGRDIVRWLIGLQFAGLYLFVPAITCGVLTHEKERASLQLLFLTRLGPWRILFEKLSSRLVPTFGLLLLSLPLLAYAYTLGGISPERLWTGVGLLVLAAFQLSAIALCCSAYFRTTAGAFIASYVLVIVLTLGPLLTWTVVFLGKTVGQTWFEQSMMETGLFEDISQIFFPFAAPFQYSWGPMPTGASRWTIVALRGVPVLSCGIAALLLARFFLVRRAFLPPRNLVLSLFKFVDRLFTRLNDNPLTKGIVVIQDRGTLPEGEPVAWREMTRRSLGRGRYLARILIALEVPVAGLCVAVALSGADDNNEPLSFLLFLVWGIAIMLVAAHAAGLIAGERSHQTLEVLCATPLASREIVLQKYRAVRRLMRVLWVPFTTIMFFECLMRGGLSSSFSLTLYLTCTALAVLVYLPLVAWLSLLIGLKVRTQGRALIGSLAAIVTWCVAPLVLVSFPLDIFTHPLGQLSLVPVRLTMLLTPATIISFNEFGVLHRLGLDWLWLPVILNFLFYGACLALFRWLCLSRAGRLLGRLEGAAPQPPGRLPNLPGSSGVTAPAAANSVA